MYIITASWCYNNETTNLEKQVRFWSLYNDNHFTYGCEDRLCSEHGPLGNHHLWGLDERTFLCCKAQGFHSAALGPWGGGQLAITWRGTTGALSSTLQITLRSQTTNHTVPTCINSSPDQPDQPILSSTDGSSTKHSAYADLYQSHCSAVRKWQFLGEWNTGMYKYTFLPNRKTVS